MNAAITISDLSKKYAIGRAYHASLADIMRNIISGHTEVNEVFYALHHVSLTIDYGEAIGIIGKNGAGKSTLLKILSRITFPTSGNVELNGRVSSLLEVGTGFHAELTGRENIYLNGTILGMRRHEIKRKLDEIISFSGVEKFIETPVKHYSSGMYVRLAFSVAAHLEPEILIIDEVLSVGDVDFQKKCLGKMNEVTSEGRTVIFVSHNMNAVKNLCKTGVFLEKGIASEKLPVNEVIAQYARNDQKPDQKIYPIEENKLVLHRFSIYQDSMQLNEFDGDQPIHYDIDIELKEDMRNFRIGVFLCDQLGEIIFRSLVSDWEQDLHSFSKGRYLLTSQIPEKFLTHGNYFLQVHCSQYGIADFGLNEKTAVSIRVSKPQRYNAVYPGENRFGNVINPSRWRIELK